MTIYGKKAQLPPQEHFLCCAKTKLNPGLAAETSSMTAQHRTHLRHAACPAAVVDEPPSAGSRESPLLVLACPLVAVVFDVDDAGGLLSNSTLRNTSTCLPSAFIAASLRGSSSTSSRGKSVKKSSDRLVEVIMFRRSVSKNFLMGGWKLGGGCSPRRIASSQWAWAFLTAASAGFGLFWPW